MDVLDKIKFKKFYTEPSNEYNIFSTVIFRTYESGHRQSLYYYNKLLSLIEHFNVMFPTFYLRIYYDKSIVTHKNVDNEEHKKENVEYWRPLIKELKNEKKIQLIRFDCDDYKTENKSFHRGTFGTLIRFIPIFDYDENKNIKFVFIYDVDIDYFTQTTAKYSIKFVKKNNLNFFFRTNHCLFSDSNHYSLYNDLKNTWLRMYANIIVDNIKLPKIIFNNFFKMIDDKQYDVYLSRFINYNIIKKKSSEQIFSYGIDEILCMYILDYIIENNIKSGYFTSNNVYRPIQKYVFRNEHFKNTSKNNIYKEILQNLLMDEYDETKSIIHNYKKYNDAMKYYSYNQGCKNMNPSKLSIKFAQNTFNFYQKIENENLYEYYGFNKNEILCGLMQINKVNIHINDYYNSFKILNFNNEINTEIL
jgi:hypothetical protein